MSIENERDFKSRIAEMENDLSSQEGLTGKTAASLWRDKGRHRHSS